MSIDISYSFTMTSALTQDDPPPGGRHRSGHSGCVVTFSGRRTWKRSAPARPHGRLRACRGKFEPTCDRSTPSRKPGFPPEPAWIVKNYQEPPPTSARYYSYNRVMARGWESKSIESQIESAEARKNTRNMPKRSSADIEALREQEGLALSRTRILNQMETCENPRYRLILDKALADLNTKLAKFELRRAAHSG
jgi:hypothetical protein